MLSPKTPTWPRASLPTTPPRRTSWTMTNCSKPPITGRLVVAYRNGAPVRLSDIAIVQDSVAKHPHRRLCQRQAERPADHYSSAPGANIIQTVDRIKDALPSLKASIPAGINLTVVLDRTTTIRQSVLEVERTLLHCRHAGHPRRFHFSAQPAHHPRFPPLSSPPPSSALLA